MDRGIFLSTASAEAATLEELLGRYETEVLPTKKSHVDVHSRVKTISRMIGFYSAAALTPRVLAAYRDKRLTKVKGHTVRKELHLVGRVLKHAQREWEINLPRGNPVHSISIPTQPKGRERRLRTGEEEKLLEGARAYGGEIEDIILLAIESGMRRGEISELRWKISTFAKPLRPFGIPRTATTELSLFPPRRFEFSGRCVAISAVAYSRCSRSRSRGLSNEYASGLG